MKKKKTILCFSFITKVFISRKTVISFRRLRRMLNEVTKPERGLVCVTKTLGLEAYQWVTIIMAWKYFLGSNLWQNQTGFIFGSLSTVFLLMLFFYCSPRVFPNSLSQDYLVFQVVE